MALSLPYPGEPAPQVQGHLTRVPLVHARLERIGTALHPGTEVNLHAPEPKGDVVAPPGQACPDRTIAMAVGLRARFLSRDQT